MEVFSCFDFGLCCFSFAIKALFGRLYFVGKDGIDNGLLNLLFKAVFSFDDKEASEEIDAVDIFEGYPDDPGAVDDESVISDEVEEEDDNGRGYIDPLSCNFMYCSNA